MCKPSRPLGFLHCYLYLLWKVGHYLPSHFTCELTKYWSCPRSQNFRLVLFLILFKEKILFLNYFSIYMIKSFSPTWVMQDKIVKQSGPKPSPWPGAKLSQSTDVGKWKLVSHVWLFAAPWTVARQAALSMVFPRQEYRSGLPFPSPRDPPDLGIEPRSSPLLSHQQVHGCGSEE